MGKKLSIHDVARGLNISAATVSYVLNGKAKEKRISPALEKKIVQYVEKHDYRPNSIAKSLRTGKSKVIAMLVEGIDDPFFSSIARIVEEKMSLKGYKMFFASTDNDSRLASELIGIFRDAQVDGYIMAPPPDMEKDISSLIDEGFAVVLFDRYFPGLCTDNVMIDNFKGVYEAMQHFFEMGYRDIGFVTLESGQIQMTERLHGYEKAMKERVVSQCIQKVAFKLRDDQAKMVGEIRDFLKGNKHLEAVLFATNYLAISGLEAIKDLKLKIPEDLAVIGFDDNTHFALFTPPVTAVAQPVRELSEVLVEQLMAILNGKAKKDRTRTIKLRTRLIARGSSEAVGTNIKK
jgi:LacI family transcriptional regulator